jgi:hypothetical protein
VAKSRPTNPSGVQLSTPIVPSGRQTRTSSAAGRGVVRGEHDADAGQDDVEGGVLEGQRLRVGLAPLELGAGGGGALAPVVEELGREV